MGSKSKIEWTDATWSPIRGRNLETGKIGWHCEHATTGCANCYAERLNQRLGTGLPFKPGHRKDISIFLDETMLTAPLRWRRPRMVFVCSMTDLFADFVEDQWIDRVFAVMALCPQHTFQVLTKRAERMRAYFGRHLVDFMIPPIIMDLAAELGKLPELVRDYPSWPLPNVWLGISAERQPEFDAREENLRETPATVRFFSLEPLLGPIDARRAFYVAEPCEYVGGRRQQIDWVIVGGESGSEARPMHPDWARSLQKQCDAASVRFFFKQWGACQPITGFADPERGDFYFDGQWFARVGKKAAGRLLDGREWNEMPAAAREPEAA